jgi:hypothetical protein
MPRMIFIMALLAHRATLLCAIARREKKQRNASHSDWPAAPPATYQGNDQRNSDRQHEDFHPGHRKLPLADWMRARAKSCLSATNTTPNRRT